MPDTQRTGLQRDAHCVWGTPLNNFLNVVRIREALPLPYSIPFAINHANRCFFQRDIQPYVLFQCSSPLQQDEFDLRLPEMLRLDHVIDDLTFALQKYVQTPVPEAGTLSGQPYQLVSQHAILPPRLMAKRRAGYF